MKRAPLPESRVIGYVGPPGSGKTQLALAHLHSLKGSYVRVAVDRRGDLPRVLFDGTELAIRRTSPGRLRFAAFKEEIHDRPIHVLNCEASEALSTCAKIASRSRPVVLMIDETAFWKSAEPARLGEDLRGYLADRGHGKLWLLWCSQFPRQTHRAMFSQSSALFLWRMVDSYDRTRMREGGIPDATIERLREIPECICPSRKAPDPACQNHRHIFQPMLSREIEPLPVDSKSRIY